MAAPYDLLIGADGVHSKTRHLYQQHDPSLRVELQPAPKDYVGFSGIPVEGYMAGMLPARGFGGQALVDGASGWA